MQIHKMAKINVKYIKKNSIFYCGLFMFSFSKEQKYADVVSEALAVNLSLPLFFSVYRQHHLPKT